MLTLEECWRTRKILSSADLLVLGKVSWGREAWGESCPRQAGLGEVWNASESSGLVMDVSKTGGKRRIDKEQFKDPVNLQPYSKDNFLDEGGFSIFFLACFSTRDYCFPFPQPSQVANSPGRHLSNLPHSTFL